MFEIVHDVAKLEVKVKRNKEEGVFLPLISLSVRSPYSLKNFIVELIGSSRLDR